MIPFNQPSITALEERYVLEALRDKHLSGDGRFTKMVNQQFKDRFGIERMLLTTSGTDSLELAALLCNLQPGDEVIAPSFTFSSTINAFLLRGAKVVFCDIRRDTYNIDETRIEALITDKTKAIFPIHYAGIPCEMDAINEIARKHGLMVVEDAAQAVGSYYKGRVCGTLSELGCYSFHATKNYSMGEGGAIVVNDESLFDRAQILREKGTNRHQLFLGQVDKYSWHDLGSSFLPSDMNAAMLAAQMERFQEIFDKRMQVWDTYNEMLQPLKDELGISLLTVPEHCTHNAHMFNVTLPSTECRNYVIPKMKERGVAVVICYVPLHSAPYGQVLGGSEKDSCEVTSDIASRNVRLPLYADMTKADAEFVIEQLVEVIREFNGR